MRNHLPLLSLGTGLLLAGAAAAEAPPPAREKPLDKQYLRDHAETRGFLLGRPVQPKPAPDGTVVLFLRAAARVPRVTTGGREQVTPGLADFVAREEMNRFSGYWWSPDSKFIAYEEADARGVEVWYVTAPARPEQKPHPSYYPRPGKANVNA